MFFTAIQSRILGIFCNGFSAKCRNYIGFDVWLQKFWANNQWFQKMTALQLNQVLYQKCFTWNPEFYHYYIFDERQGKVNINLWIKNTMSFMWIKHSWYRRDLWNLYQKDKKSAPEIWSNFETQIWLISSLL